MSPLTRTIETAKFMLMNHPNFSRIQFYVHPMLREKFHVSADIPDSSFYSLDLNKYHQDMKTKVSDFSVKLGAQIDPKYL